MDRNRLRRSWPSTLFAAAVLVLQLGSRADRVVVAGVWLALVFLPVERYIRQLAALTKRTALPHYLPASPNPRGALALVLRFNQWIGLRVDTGPLERAAAEFQNKINEAVSGDSNLSAFVRELKKREFEQ